MDKKIILIIIATMAISACNKQFDAFVDELAGEKQKPRAAARTDSDYSKELKSYTKKISELTVDASGVNKVNSMIKQAKERGEFGLTIWEKQDLNNFEAEAKKYNAAYDEYKNAQYANHKYCLAGVCIGDGIEKMGKFQWAAIDKEFKDNAVKNRKYNKTRYKASDKTMKVLAPYIMLNKFDKTALNQLDNLNAVCEPIYFDGGFYTKSKYFINVTLSAVPQKDGSHKFQVTKLVEDFRGITSERKPELAAIESKLRSQFPDVVTDKDKQKSALFKVWEHWVYFNNIYTDFAGSSVSVRILDPEGYHKGDGSVEDALMKNPKCKVSVSLD